MDKKINVAILFGGKSVEHEVSLQSGLCVASSLDPDRYTVRYIGIDKEGNWDEYDPACPLFDPEDPRKIRLGQKLVSFNLMDWKGVDIAFPVLHGNLGEDGAVQGLLRLLEIPFVGADVLGSAIGMDKHVAKRLAKEAGILTAPWTTLRRGDAMDTGDLSFPLFVKPCTGGSSIGISKVYKVLDLYPAVERAFCFSEEVLLEEALEAREIQVAVIGNQNPKASMPCEIVPKGEFHTYESKYIDKEGASFLYPAPLEPDETARVQQVALQLYQTLSCETLGRVDLFLTRGGDLFFNEINTIPGLTSMSPFSKMWEMTGVSFSSLMDQLIDLGFERHARQKQLITNLQGVKRS